MVHSPRITLQDMMRAGNRASSSKTLGEDSAGRDSNASASTVAEKLKPKLTMKRLASPVGSLLRGGLFQQEPKIEKKTRFLFASDVASRAIIREILADKGVVSLEVEDVITDKDCRSLAANLNTLVCICDRDWQSIAFVDSIAPEEFITWRGHKHAVMNVLTESFKLNPDLMTEDNVEFKAILEFEAGTSIKTFLNTLRTVSQHNLVRDIEFFGALFECDKGTIVNQLENSVDEEGLLIKSIKLEVVCGLVENPERFELVEMCLQKGRDITSRMVMDASGQHSRSTSIGRTSEMDSPAGPDRSVRRNRSGKSTSIERTSEMDSPAGPERSVRRARSGRRSLAASRRIRAASTEASPSRTKESRSRQRQRRSTRMSSPTSVTDSCDGKAKDVSERMNSSVPDLLALPLESQSSEDPQTAKMHKSLPEMGFSEDFNSSFNSKARRQHRKPRATRRTRTIGSPKHPANDAQIERQRNRGPAAPTTR